MKGNQSKLIMKYEQYLNNLQTLLCLDHEFITIYKKKVQPFSFKILFMIKEKNYEHLKIFLNGFIVCDLFHKSYYKAKLNDSNKNKWSIKQTLLIVKKLTDSLLICTFCLDQIKHTFNKQLKARPMLKALTYGIAHCKKIYHKIDELTQWLNLTYNDDLSNMNFGLNLIDDKSIDLIDFNKVLISNDWIKMLEDY